jgi:hypothetical protein
VIFLLPEVGIFYSENRGFRCQDANFDAKVALINPPISEKLSSRRTSAAGLRDHPTPQTYQKRYGMAYNASNATTLAEKSPSKISGQIIPQSTFPKKKEKTEPLWCTYLGDNLFHRGLQRGAPQRAINTTRRVRNASTPKSLP